MKHLILLVSFLFCGLVSYAFGFLAVMSIPIIRHGGPYMYNRIDYAMTAARCFGVVVPILFTAMLYKYMRDHNVIAMRWLFVLPVLLFIFVLIKLLPLWI